MCLYSCIVDEINERVVDEDFIIQNLSCSKFRKCIKRTFPKAEDYEINKLFYKIVALPDGIKEDE